MLAADLHLSTAAHEAQGHFLARGCLRGRACRDRRRSPRLWRPHRGVPRAQAHIAKVEISGFISGDDKTVDLLKRVGESRARGVLVEINSPGGTVTGSEILFDALRDLSAKKPTVAVVNGPLSGGYIAAMGTAHCAAHRPRGSAPSACCSSSRTSWASSKSWASTWRR